MFEFPNGEQSIFHLFDLGLLPSYVVLSALVWVIHDYFITLDDEVRYIWSQKWGLNRLVFIWVRYYTIILVGFDTIQIQYSLISWEVNGCLCLTTDPTTKILGAVGLWSIEGIMQLRIYLLFNRSKRVAFVNGIHFVISIGIFLWIMMDNILYRRALFADIGQLLRNGCPALNGGIQWAQWVPATVFEFVLFGLAVYKTVVSSSAGTRLNGRPSLTAILLHENILYFLVVACVLVLNNLMVMGAPRIPWISFGPFHAAIGIATCRMFIHLQKFASENMESGPDYLPTILEDDEA